MSWLGLVVCALAAYRLTRIVTTDTISEPWRDRLYRWAWVDPSADDYDERHADATRGGEFVPYPRQGGLRTYVNELFNCPWCFGVWVSAAVVAVWCWIVRDGISVALYLAMVFAVAGAQGFLASRQDA